MNFVANTAAIRKEPIIFPALMTCARRGGDIVVLFTSEMIGMQMTPNGFREEAGGWIPATNEKAWRPFTGTITVTA